MTIRSIAAFVLTGFLSVSCIREEPKNAECDIVEVTVPGDVLNREPNISNSKVLLIVKNNQPVTALAPEFVLSPGATIEPPSGTVRNFEFPQTYIVTAEDGKWHKDYIVEVQRNNSINLEYDFDHVRHIKALGGVCTYDEFYEPDPSGKDALVWASANSAFALTLQGSTPETFPTYQGDGGVVGRSLRHGRHVQPACGNSFRHTVQSGTGNVQRLLQVSARSLLLRARRRRQSGGGTRKDRHV